MKTARITISPSSAIFFIVSTMSALAAAGLSLLVWLRPDESMIPLFYPLLPGLIAGLLITGGHGGTTTEEKIAAIVAAIINGLAYFLIIVAIRSLWRLCFRDKSFVTPPK